MLRHGETVFLDDVTVEQVEQDGDCFYFVKNLEETLADCARHWALPGELGIKLG